MCMVTVWSCLAVSLVVVTSRDVVAAQSAEGAAVFHHIAGTITAIDPQRTVAIAEHQRDGRTPLRTTLAFVAAPQAGLSDLGGRALQWQDLQPGDRVTIDYAVEGGKRVAYTIVLQGWRSETPRAEEGPMPVVEPAPLDEPRAIPSSPR